MQERRFEGVDLPDPGFAGDTGDVDPALAAALAAYAEEPDAPQRYADALTSLAASRLLVPVVAVLGEVDNQPDGARGLTRDKESDMAAVLMTGRDGRTALLAFTGLEPLGRWRSDARPVPLAARDVARAALADGADALVVDLAGPSTLIVQGRPLRALAGAPSRGLPHDGADLG